MDWCPNARAISMNTNDIESFPDDPALGQLQYLNLANNNLRVCPTLPRCMYLRQLYLDTNDLGDDQIANVCRLIDTHPYLIKLKLGHNRFSPAGIAQILEHARARNPYLFMVPGSTFEQDFHLPQSYYGADAQGGRHAPSTTCWVVQAESVGGPPFAGKCDIMHRGGMIILCTQNTYRCTLHTAHPPTATDVPEIYIAARAHDVLCRL